MFDVISVLCVVVCRVVCCSCCGVEWCRAVLSGDGCCCVLWCAVVQCCLCCVDLYGVGSFCLFLSVVGF